MHDAAAMQLQQHSVFMGGCRVTGASRADVSQKSLLTGPYTLIHLLAIALLAFCWATSSEG